HRAAISRREAAPVQEARASQAAPGLARGDPEVERPAPMAIAVSAILLPRASRLFVAPGHVGERAPGQGPTGCGQSQGFFWRQRKGLGHGLGLASQPNELSRSSSSGRTAMYGAYRNAGKVLARTKFSRGRLADRESSQVE